MEFGTGINTLATFSALSIILNVHIYADTVTEEVTKMYLLDKLMALAGLRPKECRLFHEKQSRFYGPKLLSLDHLCRRFSSNKETRQSGQQSGKPSSIKANENSSLLSHLLHKRDLRLHNSTTNKNSSSADEKLQEIQRIVSKDNVSDGPCYIGLCLSNYGSHAASPNASKLTALHIGMLLLAFTGALILLSINLVGVVFCVSYFTRRPEINSLADDSFKSMSFIRKKWSLQRQMILEQDLECSQFPYNSNSPHKESLSEKDQQNVPSCPLLPKTAVNENQKTWL